MLNNNVSKTAAWKCPICIKYTPWDELYFDPTVQTILNVSD